MNEHHRSILHRIELRRRSERDKFGFAIQYEQPCSICVYSGSLAQASGLRSGQILAKVNGCNVLDARHDDVKRLVYAKHTNLLVLEVRLTRTALILVLLNTEVPIMFRFSILTMISMKTIVWTRKRMLYHHHLLPMSHRKFR